jgi:2-oxoglutarate dehydrogenase E2 component (dihydrolipoamide succinyltransferase)
MKEAQNNAASLTTFNEIDMTVLMGKRAQLGQAFVERTGFKLGILSPFVKAAAQIISKELPIINASIDIQNKQILHKKGVDISVAVATPKGLLTPVIRGSQDLPLEMIEKQIKGASEKAQKGLTELSEISGGTFTISNGGIFGSLMGTPILNPPQSAVLGMHAVKKRPVYIESKNQIEARPMMYVALTYDHRLIDGREAVSFLVKLKEAIEDPQSFVYLDL